jgi:hypothetical protein
MIAAEMAKPGLIGRALAAAKLLGGQRVDQSGWFGPLEPLAPTAPIEVAGRRYDYPSGFNLVTAPRGVDGTGAARMSFAALRALADNYDLMRLAIETRKDQLAKVTWSIRARDEDERDDDDPRIKVVTDLLAYPDREHSWDSWLRALVEDMLVVDAATVYPRKTVGGTVYALEIIDGATIKPVIDDHGRRPLPPAPAYQQVLKGLPAVDYTSDALYYFPRNYRAPMVYGLPPVEQVAMSVNIAIRRQLHQLQFYTEGTVPDALVPVPDTWSPQQIEEFQAYWDSLLTDNTAQRRKARFIPAGVAKGVVFTKEGALKDEYDEWLARIVCYAFNVSNQWAVKQMNRATADTAQEQALQEGLAPIQLWVKGVVDRCLSEAFGAPDLEFAWDEEDEVDPSQQNEITLAQVQKGLISIDEGRARLGLEPLPNGIGAKPMIYTAAGAVLVEDISNPPEPDPLPEMPPGAGVPPGPGKSPPAGQEGKIERSAAPAGGKNRGRQGAKRGAAMEKASRAGRPVPARRAKAQETEAGLAALWRSLLDSEGKRLAAAAKPGRKMEKADQPGDEEFELDPDAWDEAEEEARKLLETLALDASADRLAQLGLDDAAITALANPAAIAWAKAHAAELVAQIGDTTRDRLNELVTQAESEGWSVDKLAQSIRDDDVFGAARAHLIAHTETRTADNQGALDGMRAAAESGIQIEKSWVTRGDNVCLVCDANEADGWIDVGDDFNSGDDAAPAHPNCECDTEYRTKENEQ